MFRKLECTGRAGEGGSDVHEILLSIAGVGSLVWLRPTFILNNVPKLLRSQGFCHLMFRKLECTGRAGEGGSDVEVGAGAVDTSGLVRRVCLDLGTSNTDRLIVFGFPLKILPRHPHSTKIHLDQQKPISWVNMRITLMETQDI